MFKNSNVIVVLLIMGISGCTSIASHNKAYEMTNRSYVAEAIDAASTAQLEATKTFARSRSMREFSYSQSFPEKFAGLITYQTKSDVVGFITVTLSSDARLGEASGKTIELWGTANIATGVVSWVCLNGTINPAYLPDQCMSVKK